MFTIDCFDLIWLANVLAMVAVLVVTVYDIYKEIK